MNLSEKKTIQFTLFHLGRHYTIRAARNEYHSLMGLVADYLAIPGFGSCGGMGSCGTCMVNIYSDNSLQTGNTLSCDMPINDELAHARIIIPERLYS